MRNPLTNEDAAFRLVLGTIAFVTPVVLASWIATWLGLVTFLAAVAVVVWRLLRGRSQDPPPQASAGERADVDDTPAPLPPGR